MLPHSPSPQNSLNLPPRFPQNQGENCIKIVEPIKMQNTEGQQVSDNAIEKNQAEEVETKAAAETEANIHSPSEDTTDTSKEEKVIENS